MYFIDGLLNMVVGHDKFPQQLQWLQPNRGGWKTKRRAHILQRWVFIMVVMMFGLKAKPAIIIEMFKEYVQGFMHVFWDDLLEV